MDDPLFRCTDLTFFEQEELAEEDEVILPRRGATVVVIDEPICPLCLRSGAACHCWEDDA